MPLILFSFSFNPETQEAAIAGNINIQTALGILHQLALAEAIRKAREEVLSQKRGGNSGQEKSSNQEEEATKATEKDN